MTSEVSSANAPVVSIDYGNLMQKRIRRVLLICSSYDAFALEEDGRINVQINNEYINLNLSNPPSFKRVSSSDEALELLRENDSFDLAISMFNVGDVDIFHLSKMVKEIRPDIPVVLLANFSKDINKRIEQGDASAIDYIFYWHGNADLILTIIKLIEDRMNADNDILGVGVQCILLVEDSIKYYSTYLPAIYKLVLQQNSEFLKEALNEQQQMLRKRARPKILLATNYTEAVELYEKYKKNLLGVISDVGFVLHKGDPSASEKLDAGIDLCRLIKADNPQMPFLMQSSQESMRATAEELGVGFIAKYSKTLLLELSDYIGEEFTFGDFVFKDLTTGEVIGRAKDLRDMQHLVMEIPEEVLLYHASRNRLSKWMYSRGLFSLGAAMRAARKSHFNSTDEMRAFIAGAIREYRILQGHGVVARFDPATYNRYIWFARMGNGSLGGKGRGLAFMNSMLQKYRLYNKYEGIKVTLPRTVVVATDYFDEFIRDNGLQYVINADIADEEILSEFVSSRLPEALVEELRVYIRHATKPLAIRSSSKLEDSHYQPFAGIYSTYMIPLTDNEDQTLRLLGKAIKSVYASVYFASSRAYIQASDNLLGEEKMGIVIQEVCGSEDNGYFFPTLSGVARSLNFYPIGDEKPQDGIVNLAFGLGKLVVEGGLTLRFSPRYPKNILQLSTTELALRDTQREMYALNLKPEEFKTSIDDAVNLTRFEINKAKHFRNMRYVASTWDMQNQRITDSTFEDGRKIITFSQILKYDTIPLAEIVCDLLRIGQEEMRCPVELEFAVDMDVPYGADRTFSFLQIRPIVDSQDNRSLDWDEVPTDDALIYAENALGLGATEGVCDVVYIRNEAFDTAHTQEIAAEINALNNKMRAEKRPYVLVGPGRWGSSDPWLGIPVKWPSISEAKVIVECGLENFRVEPSQGTHFFQNLTSFGVGYLTINPFMGDGRFDAARLDRMEALYESTFVRHVRFPAPLYIYIDGRKNKGIVRENG
ncbi:PEP/pyruvate-binding domain-containing protein [uncultured Alistipes sp.]|uniref:PEP/pyruvate-binding domain-containing protein n=1 Tax=uncultured Alistipes sp. TaxID=538949 RepID=UPI00262CCC82|nr:PEP/pyruvate-binding domain-containing protein [uncultured Alistipes sp.]